MSNEKGDRGSLAYAGTGAAVDSAGQYSAGQDSVGQYSVGQDSVGQDPAAAEAWRGRGAPVLSELQRLAANPNAHLSALGLHSNPFPVAPDAEHFFLPRHLDELIAELLLAVHARKGFILLTGEVGLGKTTISRHLINILDGQKVDVALVVHTMIEPIELVKAINRDFGLPEVGDGVQSAISQLNDFLLERYAQGRNSVIVVDDAQNLSESALEALRMISNLETGSEKLVQIILIGQPELRERLENVSLRQLRSRIAIRLYVRPLNALELRQYIQFRIESATTGNTRISLTRPAFEMIQSATGGSPRLINILMDRALHGLAAENSRQIDDHLIADAIAELDLMPLPYKYRKAKEHSKRRFSVARVVSAVTVIAGAAVLLLVISQTDILKPILGGAASTAPDARIQTASPVQAPGQVSSQGQSQIPVQGQDQGQGQIPAQGLGQGQGQIPAQGQGQLSAQTRVQPAGQPPDRLQVQAQDQVPVPPQPQVQPQIPVQPQATAQSQLPAQPLGNTQLSVTTQPQLQTQSQPGAQFPPQAQSQPGTQPPPQAQAQTGTQPPLVSAPTPVSDAAMPEDLSPRQDLIQPSTPVPLPERLQAWLAPFGLDRYAGAIAAALQRGDINEIRQRVWSETGVRMLMSDELAIAGWEANMPRFTPDPAQPHQQLGLWEPTWWVTTSDFSARSDNVIALQTALRDAGTYTGALDGLAGPMTQRAVTRFQERENLPQTGSPNDATLYRLQNR